MSYPEIRNHIIDKKYFWCYSIIFLLSFLLVFLLCLHKASISISFSRGNINALLILWLSLISIGSLLNNYYRCWSFYQFYNNSLQGYNAQFNKILIEKESYKMQVPSKSYNAIVQPFPKSANAVFLETDDLILLFFSIRYIEIIQFVPKPLIFIKPNKEYCISDKSVNLIRDFKIVETKEDKTIIFSNGDS